MRAEILALIVGACGITVTLRVLPFILVPVIRIPGSVRDWLQFVPAAVMAAILSHEVLGSDDASLVLAITPEVGATAACVITALTTRSLLLTVVVGVLAMELSRYVL